MFITFFLGREEFYNTFDQVFIPKPLRWFKVLTLGFFSFFFCFMKANMQCDTPCGFRVVEILLYFCSKT
jgi:hypothetical protein